MTNMGKWQLSVYCLLFCASLYLSQVQCKTVTAKDKPGQCPPMDEDTICSSYCVNDEGCSGSSKCCSNGCALYCKEPIQSEGCPSLNTTCGVGNQTYDLQCEFGYKLDHHGCYECECDAGFRFEGVILLIFLLNIASYLFSWK